MDAAQSLAAQALAALTELSLEVERVVIANAYGTVLAATAGVDGEGLARLAGELLDVAAATRPDAAVSHVEVGLPDGSVFVVREAGHLALATTLPEPTSALVLHDLRACLRRLAEPPPRPIARRRRAAATRDDA